ncbi:hypothetical protein D3C86_1074400 [compost metagenome]
MLPLRTCGSPEDSTSMPKSSWPLIRSVTRGDTPRYGTCSARVLVAWLIISPARCKVVPTPDEP